MALRNRRRGLFGKILVFLFSIAAALTIGVVALAFAYISVPPTSTLMLARWVRGEPVTRIAVPLSAISPNLRAAVIASEDSLFCRHKGVDWGALQEVIDEADEDGPSRGASTITMQTAKNVFLWPGRSAIRKGLEIPLAMFIDFLWGKRRVLEVYFNIAEWGDGLFGAEAAAQHYFHKSARQLSLQEAALLASALPNPHLRDPAHPSRNLARRAGTIAARVKNEDTSCVD
jgi:monofunctional biosynthetic peptidoglycan transglycosylase